MTLPSGSLPVPWYPGWALEVRVASGIPPVTSAVGGTLLAVEPTVRGSATGLPAWSVGPALRLTTVTSTRSPPRGGEPSVRPTEGEVVPGQETPVATPERFPREIEKLAGASEEHSTGFEKPTVRVVPPPVACTPVGSGGTVSTVTVRVTSGESCIPVSMERKAKVWVPSARGAGDA